MSEINQFHDQLQSEVIDFSLGGSTGEEGMFKEEAFSQLVAEELSVAGVLESPISCYFESGPRNRLIKANGFGVPEEDSQLDLFISVYNGKSSPVNLNAREIDKAFGCITRFFEGALKGLHREIEPGSDAYAMVREIWNIRDEIDRVRFVLLTDGVVVQRKESERKDQVAGRVARYEIWDLERLRRFRSSGSTHESLELDLSSLPEGGIACVEIPNQHSGYASFVAVVPGKMLHDLYEEYGQRLLELNVRSYLQARGKVNKGILETLVNEPEKFLAYNNGITVVAEDVRTGKLSNGNHGIVGIKGLQIVNGGQTTASIHRAGKEKKADLSKVFVQAKITLIDHENFDEIVPLISRYSNAQNAVSAVDLKANHAFHVGVERVSKKTWAPGEQSMWFYERARGSYQTLKASQATTPARRREFLKRYPPAQKFSKEDLARYSNCWLEEPHIVSRGGQKNFAAFMSRVGDKQEGWVPEPDEYKQLIGKAILYRSIQKLVRQAEIPAFRVNVSNYTMSLLARKTARRIDLVQIWNDQKISDSLSKLLEDWIPEIEAALVDSAGDLNPTEWFKKEDCWREIRNLNLIISPDIHLELSDSVVAAGHTEKSTDSGASQLSDQDRINIARCVETNAEKWLEIVTWGSTSGKLKDWQCGIATTLASYAAQNWTKPPSQRQAKHGVAILELAEES